MECGEKFNENFSKVSKEPKTRTLVKLLELKRKEIAIALDSDERRIIIAELPEMIGKYYMDEDQRSKAIKIFLDPEVDYLSHRQYTLIGQLTGCEARAVYLFHIPQKTDSISWRDRFDEDSQKLRDVIREDLKIFDDKPHEDFQVYNFPTK